MENNSSTSQALKLSQDSLPTTAYTPLTEDDLNIILFVKRNIDWSSNNFSKKLFENCRDKLNLPYSIKYIRNRYLKDVLPNVHKYNLIDINELILQYDRANLNIPKEIVQMITNKCVGTEDDNILSLNIMQNKNNKIMKYFQEFNTLNSEIDEKFLNFKERKNNINIVNKEYICLCHQQKFTQMNENSDSEFEDEHCRNETDSDNSSSNTNDNENNYSSSEVSDSDISNKFGNEDNEQEILNFLRVISNNAKENKEFQSPPIYNQNTYLPNDSPVLTRGKNELSVIDIKKLMCLQKEKLTEPITNNITPLQENTIISISSQSSEELNSTQKQTKLKQEDDNSSINSETIAINSEKNELSTDKIFKKNLLLSTKCKKLLTKTNTQPHFMHQMLLVSRKTNQTSLQKIISTIDLTDE